MFEYKVINTAQSGVPMEGEGTYVEQVEAGLNALGRNGWRLCACIGTYMFFIREKRG